MKTINPKSQEEWRKWLKENHLIEEVVALIHYKKHTGKRAMSAQEAMDEAICFGWIDTTIKRLDEEKYVQNFRRRKKSGRWSENTQKYARRLIAEGKMRENGFAAYKQGLKNPLADQGIPKNPEPPKELLDALKKNISANNFFQKLSPSAKRTHLRWLARAKLNETRNKRINMMLKAFSEGKKVW